MKIKQSFVLALKSLAVSKMRSFLTMLGVIIGVAAVIIIISLGDGLNAMVQDQFASMGSNMIQVQVIGRSSSREVRPEDMFALAEEESDSIAGISPYVPIYSSAKVGNETYHPVIAGVSEDSESIRALKLNEGRFLRYLDIERRQNVCVIGSYFEQEAFPNGDALGQSISLGGVPYTIIGTLKSTDAQGEPTAYNDNYLYIPYINATRINGSTSIALYLFESYDDTGVEAKVAIEAELFKIYGDDDAYLTVSTSEMMSIMDTINGTIMTVLVSIAAISLLVGGIGIMNIMLVSVTERTREIGIRKSLGAKGKDIRMQFIIEAATTSSLGGVIGIIVGIGVAHLAGSMVNITAVPSISAIILSFSVSVGVGVLFGYLPAGKAAALNPIDALRHD